MTVTAQRQWDALQDQIIREEALLSKYKADVMNFTGAAENAKTEAASSESRIEALHETAKLLIKNFEQQGLKFIDDEWQ